MSDDVWRDPKTGLTSFELEVREHRRDLARIRRRGVYAAVIAGTLGSVTVQLLARWVLHAR